MHIYKHLNKNTNFEMRVDASLSPTMNVRLMCWLVGALLGEAMLLHHFPSLSLYFLKL